MQNEDSGPFTGPICLSAPVESSPERFVLLGTFLACSLLLLDDVLS